MTKEEYKFYIEADRIMAGRPVRTLKHRIKCILVPDHIGKFMLALRKVEYLRDKNGFLNKIQAIIAGSKFRHISMKLGFSIPPTVFGPGLFIPHYGTIVINGKARVGANCVLHTSTCIAGEEPKVFGDNLYISTGVVISGETTIANNVTISAQSLVNTSITESNVLVGGIPARILKPREAWYNCEANDKYSVRAKQIAALYNKMFNNTTS